MKKKKYVYIYIYIIVEYDTYGVVNETNMNPLPAAIHRVKVSRIINYFILFLVVTVCT